MHRSLRHICGATLAVALAAVTPAMPASAATPSPGYQIERLQQIAQGAGLDPQIALMYKEFVVTEAKKRHKRIADSGDDPGELDIFA